MKILALAIVLLFLSACSATMPLTAEQTFTLIPTDENIVVASVSGSYPINPEYITVRLTNPLDTAFKAAISLNYCNNPSETFTIPARDTISVKLFTGCIGKQPKEAVATITLDSDKTTYIKKLTW